MFQVIKKKLKGIMTWINQKSRSLSSDTAPVPEEGEAAPELDTNDAEDDDMYETVSYNQYAYSIYSFLVVSARFRG